MKMLNCNENLAKNSKNIIILYDENKLFKE